MLTGTRAEYGILYWTIRRIHEDPDLDLALLVTGTHLSPEFGLTVQEVESDGFPIAAKVEMLLSSDTGAGAATSMGVTTLKMAQVLNDQKPDLLLVLGDRTEVLATVVAALPLLIPVAHIHGGESTEGLIDEGVRHAVTKLSHLHFPATEFYAQRLAQMGEETWRIHCCGAPSLEHLNRTPLPSREEVETDLGLDLDKPTLLVTYHPVTLSPEGVGNEVDELVAALKASGSPVVATFPNADAGGRSIIDRMKEFEAGCPQMQLRVNLGSRRYLGLMRYAAAMVGNSSSGIIEASSFGLPVVNIGERQRGRLRGPNVIDVPPSRAGILKGIKRALDPEFHEAAVSSVNPYDAGNSSETIVSAMKEVELGQRLLHKRMIDLPSTTAALRHGEKL